MKDQIPKLTEICKQLADIRDIHLARGGGNATNEEIRNIEQQVADLRELFDWD